MLSNVLRGRPSDPVSVDIAKGGIAAVMEVKMRSGLPAIAAAQWVIDHTTNATKRKIGYRTKLTAHTVKKWREKFSGDFASPGPGLTNFRRIVRVWESIQGSRTARSG